MASDTAFLEEMILGMDTGTLEWLQIRIGRIIEARKPETTSRRAIIRKA